MGCHRLFRTSLVSMARPPGGSDNSSPFVEYDRETWADLAPKAPLPLPEDDIAMVRSVGDMLDASDVVEV